MRSKKSGSIFFVMDERLSREKSTLLARTINALRTIADIHVITGGISEEDLLKKLEEKTPQLVLAPWYRYLAWSRVEAFYGLTRTSGPTFAGYFCEPLLPYELGETADHLRAILLDFGSLSPSEVTMLVKALLSDTRRAGLLPLLESGTTVYCENWYSGQGLGARMDTLLSLPEIANSDWSRRGNAIRVCMNALWSLIYDDGPGKSDFHQAITPSSPKAYFQVAADRRLLTLRLCYTMPAWGPKEALTAFWPDKKKFAAAPQLLLRFADFVRVHRITENNDIEIVAAFLSSRVQPETDAAADAVRTLWIEPLTARLVSEVPFESPSPVAPHLKPLPPIPGAGEPKLHARSAQGAQERFIMDAAVKIRDLKKLLTERDEMIRDLRAGGVGTAQPLPPPDAESLLEAFQERYFEARFQIRQFEIQIHQMESRGVTPQEIETIRLKMQALANREQAWIRKLAQAIEAYREAKRNA